MKEKLQKAGEKSEREIRERRDTGRGHVDGEGWTERER